MDGSMDKGIEFSMELSPGRNNVLPNLLLFLTKGLSALPLIDAP